MQLFAFRTLVFVILQSKTLGSAESQKIQLALKSTVQKCVFLEQGSIYVGSSEEDGWHLGWKKKHNKTKQQPLLAVRKVLQLTMWKQVFVFLVVVVVVVVVVVGCLCLWTMRFEINECRWAKANRNWSAMTANESGRAANQRFHSAVKVLLCSHTPFLSSWCEAPLYV